MQYTLMSYGVAQPKLAVYLHSQACFALMRSGFFFTPGLMEEYKETRTLHGAEVFTVADDKHPLFRVVNLGDSEEM